MLPSTDRKMIIPADKRKAFFNLLDNYRNEVEQDRYLCDENKILKDENKEGVDLGNHYSNQSISATKKEKRRSQINIFPSAHSEASIDENGYSNELSFMPTNDDVDNVDSLSEDFKVELGLKGTDKGGRPQLLRQYGERCIKQINIESHALENVNEKSFNETTNKDNSSKSRRKSKRSSLFCSFREHEREGPENDGSPFVELIQKVRRFSKRDSTSTWDKSSDENVYELYKSTNSLRFFYNIDDEDENIEEVHAETLPDIFQDGNFALVDGLIELVDNPSRYKNLEVKKASNTKYAFHARGERNHSLNELQPRAA